MWTEKLLKHLHDRDESPWAEDGRKPATEQQGLAKPAQAVSDQVEAQFGSASLSAKGYLAEDFADAWNRYLDPSQAKRYKRYKRYNIDNQNNNVTDVADVDGRPGNGSCPACNGTAVDISGKGCPTCHPENYGMKPRPAGGYGKGGMQ